MSVTVQTARGQVPPEYAAMAAKDGHENFPAFLHSITELFKGVDFEGKQVLEIGSGRGLMAAFMGLQGASRVVSLEPEMVGATSGVIAQQRARLETLGLRNVEIVTADFNTWDSAGARFDVILSRASINHLYASDKHALHDRETYENYLRIAQKIHGLLRPHGVFIATDACRYAFFLGARAFGIRRNPKRTGVDWRYHQNPRIWRRTFREAGFSQVEIEYPVPMRLQKLSPVINTSIANFFLKGTFILRAYRLHG